MKKTEIYRSIEITDKVKTSSLSIIDQIRLILSSLSNNDVNELDVAEKLTSSKLRKISSLHDLFNKAIDGMEERRVSSVTLKITSEYFPYLDKVINADDGLGQFYDIHVEKGDASAIHHYYIVKVSKKG